MALSPDCRNRHTDIPGFFPTASLERSQRLSRKKSTLNFLGFLVRTVSHMPRYGGSSSLVLTACVVLSLLFGSVVHRAGGVNVFAVFSSSYDCRYLSAVSLTAYVWMKHLGVVPIVILPRGGPLTEALSQQIGAFGGRVVVLEKRPKDLESTSLQVSRLAAFKLPFVNASDIVLTSDADLWPLNRRFWRNQINRIREHIDRLVVLNGPHFFAQLAIGSIDLVALSCLTANASQWETLFTTTFKTPNPVNMSFTDIVYKMLDRGEEFYGKDPWASNRDRLQWSWDQVLATMMLKDSKFLLGYIHFNRHMHRLDRSDWNISRDVLNHTDTHLPFPLSSPAVWAKVRPVWEALFPDGESLALTMMATINGKCT